MFPIILDTKLTKVIVVGNGPATTRRLELLDAAEAPHVLVYADTPSNELLELAGGRLEWRLPTKQDFQGATLVFIADFPKEQSLELAELARNTGALVNTEDIKEGCDFHVPAMVRRGDLLLTVSTNGKSPRLARRIRQMLEKWFPATWAEHVDEIGIKREAWKEQGADFEELAANTDQLLEERGWLENVERGAWNVERKNG